MNIGGPEFLIILLVMVFLAIPLVALISVVMHPTEEFNAIGQSRATWIILLVIGLMLTVLGLVLGSYYLLTVRPKLRRPATD